MRLNLRKSLTIKVADERQNQPDFDPFENCQAITVEFLLKTNQRMKLVENYIWIPAVHENSFILKFEMRTMFLFWLLSVEVFSRFFSVVSLFGPQYWATKKNNFAAWRELKIQIIPHQNYEPLKNNRNLHSLRDLYLLSWSEKLNLKISISK